MRAKPIQAKSLLIALGLFALPVGAAAQEEELQPLEAPLTLAPDMLAQARAAAARGDPAEALSRYLRVLAAEPDNVAALGGAGRAALDVGDVNAAVGFYARAEDLAPRDGAVKAGLASAMTQFGRAREALRFFRDAVAAGIAPAAIAADRGLAYDLTGQPKRAQIDYQLALRTAPDDEIVRRLALSLAIGGDRAAALATLDPLLRRQNVPAWRARAFVYAITGDPDQAERDALTVMPPDQAAALRPYLVRLATMKPADRAMAVHLGRFPSDGRGAMASAATRPNLPVDRSVLAGPQLDAGIRATTPLPQFGPAPQRPAEIAPATDRATITPAELAASRAELTATPRSGRAAARARAEAAAATKKERAEAAAASTRERAAAARGNPARQWVQVAGGANKADLPKAWAALKAKWGGQLAGRTPWTMHYRFTNRLLIGPFASADAAQDYVAKLKADGLGAFRVETEAGTAVERLGTK